MNNTPMNPAQAAPGGAANPQLAGMLAGWAGPSAGMPMPGVMPAGAMGFAGPTAPQGVLVPINVSTAYGEASLYVHFGAESAGSPQAVQMLLMQLAGMGWPVRFHQPRQQGFGGGQWQGGGNGYGNNGFGGGGFGGGGGGFRRSRW